MKKMMMKVMLCLLVSGALFSLPALAAEISNHELGERLKQLEEKMEQGILPGDWARRITLSGVIEVEASYEKTNFAGSDVEDEDSSDFSLATVELGVDADIVKHVSGHILFLYEDGEDITVDEGFILLDGKDVLPLYLKAGEIYVPFGNFESHMISDPLTLELGETRETAVQAGFEVNGFYGSVYAFNGDIDKDGDDSHIDNYGADAGYAMATDSFNMDIGVSWINNIADSGGYRDRVDEEAEEAEAMGFAFAFRDYVPGIGAHAIFNVGPAILIGEYVALLEEPEWNLSDMVPGSLAALGLGPVYKGKKISAWNIELGYTIELYGKETSLAIAFQGTKDAENWLPEKRYMGSIGVCIFNGTTLALEYLHDEFETDDETDVLTAQLAIEF